MSEIGLVEIFSMAEAAALIATLFVIAVLLQKTSTEPVSRHRN